MISFLVNWIKKMEHCGIQKRELAPKTKIKARAIIDYLVLDILMG